MSLQDKRITFVKNLHALKKKEKINIGTQKNYVKPKQDLSTDVLFNTLNRKYTLKQKQDIEYLKMEIKKYYY
jgi:hypothetical protein